MIALIFQRVYDEDVSQENKEQDEEKKEVGGLYVPVKQWTVKIIVIELYFAVIFNFAKFLPKNVNFYSFLMTAHMPLLSYNVHIIWLFYFHQY